MEENFIPYKESLILNELGFDRNCFGWYNSERSALSVGEGWRSGINSINAPLYQQAFRWFREKYNLGSFVNFDYRNTVKIGYYFCAGDFYSKVYKTYEEAELECLKKLIEIVKSK